MTMSTIPRTRAARRRQLRNAGTLALLLLALTACSQSAPTASPRSDTVSAAARSPIATSPSPIASPSPAGTAAPVVDGFVRVPAAAVDEPVVDLAYRDYGGEGSPILLLAGLGDTAAVFDELGPLLRSSGHRVVALTRRGFGASTKATTGYDVTTRTLDDVAAITALGLESPVVVGHSIASDELIGLATDYAGSISGVVSLDAMIDRSVDGDFDALSECGASLQSHEPALSLDPADPYGSIARHQNLLNGFTSGNGLANIRAQVALADRDVQPTAPQSAVDQIIQGARTASPRYSGMSVPVLAIVSLPSRDVMFPWLGEIQADGALLEAAAECARISRDLARANAADLDSQIADATVVTWEGAHHYQFLHWPQRTADAITGWMSRAAVEPSSSGQSPGLGVPSAGTTREAS